VTFVQVHSSVIRACAFTDLMACFKIPCHADKLNAAIQDATVRLNEVINDCINNLDLQDLFLRSLRKALDYRTYINLVPDSYERRRLDSKPGSPSVTGESEPFLDFEPRSRWETAVDILFEVDEQYPDVLKVMCAGIIGYSCACAMTLLILQDWDTRW
jgi:hypothetical protein